MFDRRHRRFYSWRFKASATVTRCDKLRFDHAMASPHFPEVELDEDHFDSPWKSEQSDGIYIKYVKTNLCMV